MPTETQELLVFNGVVKHASFAKAADELNLSPSGVSRVVTRLEERLGARLVQRTTRKLSLTEAGTSFHLRTSQILADLAEAEAEVQKVLANRFVDLIEEGMDLAIRIGSLADSRLVARRLCTNRRVLVAAPSYLKRHGKPKTVEDLARHQCVLFTGFSRPGEWKLIGPEGPVGVSVAGRGVTNNVVTLTSAAQQGLGITVGATLAVGPSLLAGDLVRVLPEYEFEPSAVFAVYPSARQLSTKTRAAVDFLAAKLTDPPTWDQRLRG